MKHILAVLAAVVMLVTCGPENVSAGPSKNKSPYKTCPDGSQVRANQKCSTATPTPTPGVPSFAVQDATASEEAGTVTVHIVKTGSTASSSTITYQTANGTAGAGDYTSKSGSITFAAGDTDKTVSVSITNDSAAEATEYFNVNIAASSNGTISDGNGVVTITDTDQLPPSFAIQDVTVDENAGTALVHILKTGSNGSSSTLTYRTLNGSATAGSDYTSVNSSITFSNAETNKTVSVPITDDTDDESNETVVVSIAASSNATITDSSAVITITDNDETAPPPDPVPTPGLAGLDPIDSNFNTTPEYYSVPIPGNDEVEGAFRFICNAGPILNDDPILFKGQPGKSHLHQFYGNNGINAYSDFESLRTTGTSSCGMLNRSGYWMPALLDGKGNVVRPDYITIYYKRRPASDPVVSDPGNAQYQGQAVPLPHGLRFIFGWDPTGTTSFRTGSAWFNCDGPTGTAGHYETLPEAFAHCPAGNRVGAVIIAPACWDGENLDSSDHRSHVSYAGYGDWGYLKCDAQHPYVIPQFTLGAWYTIAVGDDTSKWSFSSDHMAPGQPAGYTFHADWFGAWDPAAMTAWMDHCIDQMLNCSGGNLGNGTAMQPTTGFSWTAIPRLVPISSIPETPVQ
jgi:hypothetical protein